MRFPATQPAHAPYFHRQSRQLASYELKLKDLISLALATLALLRRLFVAIQCRGVAVCRGGGE